MFKQNPRQPELVLVTPMLGYAVANVFTPNSLSVLSPLAIDAV
jgi:hypothetical protein